MRIKSKGISLADPLHMAFLPEALQRRRQAVPQPFRDILQILARDREGGPLLPAGVAGGGDVNHRLGFRRELHFREPC
jgi:hypothetical protein